MFVAGFGFPPAFARSLAEQLLAVERMPQSQLERRTDLLQAMKPQPGSDHALERLFLLDTSPRQAPLPAQQWLDWSAQAAPDRAALGPWARQLAQMHRLLAQRQFRQVMELAESISMPPPQASALWKLRYLTLRARALEQAGNHESALLLWLEAEPVAERQGPVWRHVQTLHALARCYRRVGQHERALTIARESLLLAEKNPSAELLTEQHALLSATLGKLGNAIEGQRHGELAVEQARLTGDTATLALQLANHADNYLRKGAPAKALTLVEEAYALTQQPSFNERSQNVASLVLLNRGIALIQLGRLRQGQESVRLSVIQDMQNGALGYAAESLIELGEALEKAGDLPGAYKALREARELDASASSQAQGDALAVALRRFETSQRGREAERLRQRNAAKAESLRAERLRMGLGALALACGAALLWVIVLLLQRMRRTNLDLASTNQALAEASERDPLTGVGNRRRLTSLLGRCGQPHADNRIGLILLDIDHFKHLNDQHGHAAGDAVLVAFAGRLTSAVRGSGDVIRWGGEEFLVLLPNADASLTATLAQRLLAVLGEGQVALRDGRALSARCSVGALSLPLSTPKLSLEQGIDLADGLMYRAKSHGRNQAWCLIQANAPDLASLLLDLGDPDCERITVQRFAGVPLLEATA